MLQCLHHNNKLNVLSLTESLFHEYVNMLYVAEIFMKNLIKGTPDTKIIQRMCKEETSCVTTASWETPCTKGVNGTNCVSRQILFSFHISGSRCCG